MRHGEVKAISVRTLNSCLLAFSLVAASVFGASHLLVTCSDEEKLFLGAAVGPTMRQTTGFGVTRAEADLNSES